MTALIKQHKRSIQFKTFLGLCPFVIAPDQKTVRVSIITTIYTAVVAVFAVIFYPYLTWYIITTGQTDQASETRHIATMLEQTTVAAAFAGILTVSFLTRTKHSRFLNSLATIYDCWMPQCEHTTWQMLARHTIITVLYIFFTAALVLFVWDSVTDWLHVVYHSMYILSIITEISAVLHVGEIAMLLGDAYSMCYRKIVDQRNDSVIDVIALVSALECNKIDFDNCFGVQLLLFEMKDFLFLTSVTFYTLVEVFFAQRTYSLKTSFFLFTFLGPVTVKNGWLLCCVHRLQGKVCI